MGDSDNLASSSVLHEATPSAPSDGPLDQDFELFKKLFDTMPQLGWTARPDGFVDFYNKGWYEYTGLTSEELQGWGWQKVHDPAYLPLVKESWEKSIATGTVFEMEFPLKRHDGKWETFSTRVNPLTDSQNNILRWVGIHTNIQAFKDQLATTQEQDRRFRNYADFLPDMVWTLDNNLNLTYINARWYQYTGAAPSSALGHGWQECVRPDSLEQVLADWAVAVEKQSTYEGEQFLKNAQGEYRCFLVRGVPFWSERAKKITWFGTCTDIHERKELREHLAEKVAERTAELANAKALIELILQSMADAVVICDKEGRLNYLNEAAQNLHGGNPPRRLKDVPALNRLCTIDGTTLAVEDLPLSQALTGKSIDDYELLIRQPNGKEAILLASARPLSSADGTYNGAVCVLRDITARKAMEFALQQARDQAIAADQAKSTFLSTVSHEVRTPLAGVIGMVELLSLSLEDAERRHMADTALDSSTRLLQILNDLLDASKLQAGKIVLENRFFPLRAVIGDVSQLVKPDAEKKKVAVKSVVAEDVPELACGDELRLRQVLLNLVFNAVKFTLVGEVNIKCAVAEKLPNGARILFSVADTGIGISPDQMKLLFQPFTQMDSSTTRVFGGTGLGLSICKDLVSQMGGEIKVVSEPGKGSEFSFSLPFINDSCVSQ
jgi:PAS domain S-box-containing protein